MNPELEFYLQSVFDSVEPTSNAIGRVVVEPDYDVEQRDEDRDRLRQELVAFVQEQPIQASEAQPPEKYPILRKYVRSISLHSDHIEGPWVEVTPPGNWI